MKRPLFRDKCPVSAADPNVKGHEPLVVEASGPYPSRRFPDQISQPQYDTVAKVAHVIVTTACKHCGRMFSFTEDLSE